MRSTIFTAFIFISAAFSIFETTFSKSFGVTNSSWAYCDGSAYVPDPATYGYGKIRKPEANWVCDLPDLQMVLTNDRNDNIQRCVNANLRECASTLSQSPHGDHNVPSLAWFWIPGDVRCRC